jgi:hypothetical protein
MLDVNTLDIALASDSLGPPAGWLFVYRYTVCDLAFIMSQAKGMPFVYLEAKHLGQTTLGASRCMNENI